MPSGITIPLTALYAHSTTRFKIKLIYRRPGFDIDAAIIRIHKEIDKRADKKSIGYCARYVRWGLESGGMSTSNRPNYDYKKRKEEKREINFKIFRW